MKAARSLRGGEALSTPPRENALPLRTRRAIALVRSVFPEAELVSVKRLAVKAKPVAAEAQGDLFGADR